MRLSLFTTIAKGEEFVSKIRIYHLTFGPKEYSLTVDASSNAKTGQAKENTDWQRQSVLRSIMQPEHRARAHCNWDEWKCKSARISWATYTYDTYTSVLARKPRR